MDDGIGMTNNQKHAKEKKKYHLSGIGIQNVHGRIQLLYGQEYGVKIESEEGYGTSVKIHLPVVYKDHSTIESNT
ncbi:hypothetical protein D3C77_708480 [compost metagenome]